MSEKKQTQVKWGYLRETRKQATGFDADTGLSRTCLEDYLKVIFPNTSDWVFDKETGIKSLGRRRPDARSDSLKMIVEVDGTPHYCEIAQIVADEESTNLYKKAGYEKVVRIPYFIQLSNDAVKELFGVEVEDPLFDESYSSMGICGKKINTPATLCHAGVVRMAKEFKKFPKQYETNISYLKSLNNEFLTGVDLLIEEYNKL